MISELMITKAGLNLNFSSAIYEAMAIKIVGSQDMEFTDSNKNLSVSCNIKAPMIGMINIVSRFTRNESLYLDKILNNPIISNIVGTIVAKTAINAPGIPANS